MLPMMTPRYYSISSSPLAAPDRCSVTVAVVREPALSGDGTYEGVASTYLAKRDTGLRVNAFVKSSKSGFALPSDTTRPIVMIGPGTGLAPFRGFLQERSILRAGGATLGTAMLFFGCRNPDEDYLYRDELERFAADGIVDLHVAFSRYNGTKTYVQHLIAKRADAIWHLLENDAHVFVCGDGSAMEPAVRATFTEIYRMKTGSTEDESERWLSELVARERYSLDVWASS
jgi:cytochrome P450/NADPH-cytochrome P450 reductase